MAQQQPANSEGWKKEVAYWLSPVLMAALMFFAKQYMDRLEARLADLMIQVSEQRTLGKVLEYRQTSVEVRVNKLENKIP